MIAQVIVDVAAKETDRPFDYLIPGQLQDFVSPGSRVIVPFGGRKLLGFVISVSAESKPSPFRIKPIERVCELSAALTPELLELSDWLSARYFCRRITALQAMLPAALKASYSKKITVVPDTTQNVLLEDPQAEQLFNLIHRRGSIDSVELLERFPLPLIKHLLSKGILTEVQQVADKANKKLQMMVFPSKESTSSESHAMERLSHAPRQRETLALLQKYAEPIPMQQLIKQQKISASTIKGLAEKGFVQIKPVEIRRDPYADRQFKVTKPLQLTPQQSLVYHQLKAALSTKEPCTHLLHGVTGSGKTEVYLQAIQYCMEQGRESIVLVPEISLTPQMVERFKGRFGNQVAVLHSRLSKGERYDEWRKIKEKQVKVAIGARSAIFAPFCRLGLMIIDEEHEASYKQEESPKYEAKEVARQRAQYHRAVVVLGSATPSLEDYYTGRNPAAEQSIEYLQLSRRVADRALPKVEIVDLRNELRDGNRSMFSRSLIASIQHCLKQKEQVVLMLNRRGYSTFVICRSCGYTEMCPHCEISLTYHRHSSNLRCHYCGYAQKENRKCPQCDSEHIRFFGTGTQKVEEELGKLLPGIRVIRMDVDTTSEKGAHEKWLGRFERHEADVLLGTQMVAKGLDFPKVTLVGVIAADTMLHLPDFRAAEKTFQLLTQVAGRAGRHELPGKVIIQTYNPDHYSIHHASRHDYHAFAQRELLLRKQHPYPPFCRIILITLSHEQVNLIIKVGERLVQAAKRLWKAKHPEGELDINGPVASPMPKLKDRYRFQCMLRHQHNDGTLELLREVLQAFDEVSRKKGLAISVDVNPQKMM